MTDPQPAQSGRESSVFRRYAINGWGYTIAKPVITGADVWGSGFPEVRRGHPPLDLFLEIERGEAIKIEDDASQIIVLPIGAQPEFFTAPRFINGS